MQFVGINLARILRLSTKEHIGFNDKSPQNTLEHKHPCSRSQKQNTLLHSI